MENKHIEIIGSLLHFITQLAKDPDSMSVIEDQDKYAIGTPYFADLGKELFVPKKLVGHAMNFYDDHRDSVKSYSFIRSIQNYMQMLETNQIKFETYDFAIIDQALKVVRKYLEFKEADCDNDVFYELIAKTAFYMKQNVLIHRENQHRLVFQDLSVNPGGFLSFQRHTNVISFLDDYIENNEDLFDFD